MPALLSLTVRSVVRYFLAGVVAILPVVITVAVIAWAGEFVFRFLGPRTVLGEALRRLGLRFATDETAAYVLGGVLVLAFIVVIGVIVEAGAKVWMQRMLDAVLHRIPVVSSVYSTSKQLVDLVDRNPNDNLKSMTPVYCLFGDKSGAGVLGLQVSAEPYRIDGKDYYIVIVPTAPVPVGGALLLVPVEAVRRSDMSMEAFVSIYVSMGVTAPQFRPPAA